MPLADAQLLDAMHIALEQADEAARHGDVPVGAVVVDASGKPIGLGRNMRELAGDPTAHAEVVALRQAAQRVGRWRLEGTTLVVTLEPCLMCAGALVNARVEQLVFGARDPKAGAVRSLYEVTEDARLNHRLVVREGLCAEQSAAKLRAFFQALRTRSP